MKGNWQALALMRSHSCLEKACPQGRFGVKYVCWGMRRKRATAFLHCLDRVSRTFLDAFVQSKFTGQVFGVALKPGRLCDREAFD